MSDEDRVAFTPPVAAIPSRKTSMHMTEADFNPLPPKPQRKPRRTKQAAPLPVKRRKRKARTPKPAPELLALPAFKVLVGFMKLDRKTRNLVVELAKALP